MLTNNPINLVVDGKVAEFDSLHEFYRKVLEMLYHEFPRGYIDYKVFLYDNTMLRGTPLGECCRFIERSWDTSEDFCLKVHWTYGLQTREILTDLVRKMSRSAGNYFVLAEFEMAWKVFFQSINKE